ncbi:MAG: flagellar biosynthesis protein FlgL [Clostridiales bacterium]|nr:flagellar biosynthesis protein FlgL [Clostridiales bacterium]
MAMRITNNMITDNAKRNINNNKVMVDKYNTQMTTQKKISRASEDPVVAIRSLRLQTSLSHIDQYLTNSSDVEAWLDIAGTALSNMGSILTDIHTLCVNGSTGTLTDEDRNTILSQLQALAEQVYTEGNADYAGRTVFTGYKTNSMLTFGEDDEDVTYEIDQSFSASEISEQRYYYGTTEIPTSISDLEDMGDCETVVGENTYYRLRMAYSATDNDDLAFSVSYTVTGDDGNETTTDLDVTVYATEDDWYQATLDDETGVGKTLEDGEVIYIQSTGELIFSSDVEAMLKKSDATIDVTYTKTGFNAEDARPEYYYDCRMTQPDANTVTYTKREQKIDFTLSTGITLSANIEASEIFDTSIARDVEELINVVSAAIDANSKLETLQSMTELEEYSSDDAQAMLQTYIDAAQKEADYANDNMQKTYEQYITNFNNYFTKVNSAITEVGCVEQRLNVIKTRVEDQQTTVKELKSTNDDRDITDIIIDYYAAYDAYTASLQAAAKLNSQTLLNFL